MMMVDGRISLYTSPSGTALENFHNALVFSALDARLSPLIDFSSAVKAYIPPATLESLLIVCSPH